LVENLRIQPSGSLQYVPWDLNCETEILAHPVGAVLSFATQKLSEVTALAKACVSSNFQDQSAVWKKYRAAVGSNAQVAKRIQALTEADFARSEPFETRRPKQLKDVPLLPTTTIGSFPQTKAIRKLRTDKKKGLLSVEEYNAAIDKQIAYSIGIQDALGLDILVHGEAERTDMVEFFAQQMEGMMFTTNGWVQSFGLRCVRPPTIWFDVHRPTPMTTREFSVAQGLTEKPVKGMLTGPVTILNWSFPRSDISRKEQAMQIGLSIRDEIPDLEAVGCTVVQVDEPGPSRGHADASSCQGRVPQSGRRLFPSLDCRRSQRDTDSYAHVLLRVQRLYGRY
jgi:5-methyltetrahydropteroyltriglutamate--homocysteine methyltransferase